MIGVKNVRQSSRQSQFWFQHWPPCEKSLQSMPDQRGFSRLYGRMWTSGSNSDGFVWFRFQRQQLLRGGDIWRTLTGAGSDLSNNRPQTLCWGRLPASLENFIITASICLIFWLSDTLPAALAHSCAAIFISAVCHQIFQFALTLKFSFSIYAGMLNQNSFKTNSWADAGQLSSQSPLSVAASGQIHRPDWRTVGKDLKKESRKHEIKKARKPKMFFVFSVFRAFVIKFMYFSGSLG